MGTLQLKCLRGGSVTSEAERSLNMSRAHFKGGKFSPALAWMNEDLCCEASGQERQLQASTALPALENIA